MRLYASIFFLLVLSGLICAGTPYFKYKMVRKDGDLAFPILKSRSYAAVKINRTLQLDELHLLAGFETKDIFENVEYDYDSSYYWGIVILTPKIYRNSNKSLSLYMWEASQGATSYYNAKYYNFNSGNGDLVRLRDLFTPAGYSEFVKRVTRRRIAELWHEVNRKVVPEERQYFSYVEESYERDTDLEDYFIFDGNIYIDGENSFHKGMKFFNVETVSKFHLSGFKRYLNDYGKCFFSLIKCSIADFHSSGLPQLFEGTMGGKPAVMFLKDEVYGKDEVVHHITGWVANLDDRQGRFLEGSLNEGKLILDEKNKDSEKVGFIDAEFDGSRIIGTWTDKDHMVSEDISLSRTRQENNP